VYNLVIIYEDMAAGKRAKHFCENLMRDLDEASLGIKDLWSFKVLDIPHVRRTAAEASAIADVVILALNGHAELPDGIKAWMEQWSKQEADRKPILLALFGASDDTQEAVVATRAFLGAIAETAGLTFLHTRRQAAMEDPLAA